MNNSKARAKWLAHIGLSIREWRLKRGMTQVALACKMRIGNVVQCRRERGQVDFPTWVLAEYAKQLRVPVTALLP